MAKLEVGFCEEKGVRPTMEDTHIVIPDLNKEFKIKGEKMALFAVFDGHGGDNAAKCAKEIFPGILVKDQEFMTGNYERSLHNAFLKTDQEIMKRSEKEQWFNGCTAVVALVVGKRIYTANLGDAEATLASKIGKEKITALPLSTKHNPTDESEKLRIEQAGGQVIYGRINGTLAVSRSFGDYQFKYPYNKALKDYVSVIPSLQMTPIGKNNPFLLISCDGLYEKFDYEQLVTFAEECYNNNKGKDLNAVCKAIVDEALKRETGDNCTILMVVFKWK